MSKTEKRLLKKWQLLLDEPLQEEKLENTNYYAWPPNDHAVYGGGSWSAIVWAQPITGPDCSRYYATTSSSAEYRA